MMMVVFFSLLARHLAGAWPVGSQQMILKLRSAALLWDVSLTRAPVPLRRPAGTNQYYVRLCPPGVLSCLSQTALTDLVRTGDWFSGTGLAGHQKFGERGAQRKAGFRLNPVKLPTGVAFQEDVLSIRLHNEIQGCKLQAQPAHEAQEPATYLIGKPVDAVAQILVGAPP